MSYLKKTLYTMPPIILFFIVMTKILSFIGIGIESYAIYFIWIIAANIFYIVLPSNKSSIKF